MKMDSYFHRVVLIAVFACFNGCSTNGKVTVPEATKTLWVEDNSTSLSCRATGNPPEVTWSIITGVLARWSPDDGITIVAPNGKYNMTGDGLDFQLIIKNLSLTDAQPYTCMVQYEPGEFTYATINVNVNVRWKELPDIKGTLVVIAYAALAFCGSLLLAGLLYGYCVLYFGNYGKSRSLAVTETTLTNKALPISELSPEQVMQIIMDGSAGPYIGMKPISSAVPGKTPSHSGDDEYVGPNFTRKESQPMYENSEDPQCVNTAKTEEDDDIHTYQEIKPEVQSSRSSVRADSKENVRPSIKQCEQLKRTVVVYMNTEGRVFRDVLHDPEYINTVSITTQDDETTTYMEI